jgi:hypothetical protein
LIDGGQQVTAPVPDVLRVAQQDAEAAYGDLTGYQITLSLKQDGWHVDYT